KHANASEIEVYMMQCQHKIHLSIVDNGEGFEPEAILGDSQDNSGHYGLKGMMERAEMMGAALTVTSALGAGTKIQLMVNR
ncbi:MAG: ATP-binding protein, partial [Chloroflexota bacterium]